MRQAVGHCKRILVLAALLGVSSVLGLAPAVQADPINFIPGATGINITFTDFENTVGKAGDPLFGIFNVKNIQNLSGTVTYWNGNGGSDGTQLVGKFTGLVVDHINPAGGGFDIFFTGGTVTVYDVPNGSFNPTVQSAASLDLEICGVAVCPASELWLVADFKPGIVTTGTAAEIANTTLFSHVNSLTAPFTGSGQGFMDVTGGPNKAFFDTNGFPLGRDLFFQSTIQSCAPAGPVDCGTGNQWNNRSQDPVQAKTRIPAPASLVLLGLGLLGASMWGRFMSRG
jgi:hypothetical protein